MNNYYEGFVSSYQYKDIIPRACQDILPPGGQMVAWQFPDLELCDWMFDYVVKQKEDGKLKQGQCYNLTEGGRVHTDSKNSWDLPFRMDEVRTERRHGVDEFMSRGVYVMNWIEHCLLEYKKLNPQLLTDAIAFENGLNQYQFYEPGQGFYIQHCERKPGIGVNGLTREVVFQMYLNDIDEYDDKGTPIGGTIWPKQNVTTPCRKGLTVFWPAGHDYLHAGSVSHQHRKVITTGWIGTVH